MGRPLNAQERQQLQRQGCWAPDERDWERVAVPEEGAWGPERVRNVQFRGACRLGRFSGRRELEEGVSLPAGVFNCSLEDCSVGDDALVTDCVALVRTDVGPGAVCAGSGTVTCSLSGSRCGNGLAIAVGPGVGGRAVPCVAETLLDEVAAVALDRTDAAGIARQAADVEARAAALHTRRTVIGAGARVLQCPLVRDALVGPHALVRGSEVDESTLLSSAEEPTEVTGRCELRQALLQRGVRVSSGAIVRRSLLCEYSAVDRAGIVQDSVLGPDSSVAEGECSYSLVGPFVGMHHHSLLIATLWPEGKGNVGAGANVGSNHTGKAPDQELRSGEGVFFGLGVNIKFPSDFRDAQHSIVATGTSCLPQRVTMPFSLINVAAAAVPGLSPAINEIVPAWVLRDNAFTVVRNEQKFASRLRARRHDVTTSVLNAATVASMRAAAAALEAGLALTAHRCEGVLTDREVPGLGKNFCTLANAGRAVETYRRFARLHELRVCPSPSRALRAERAEAEERLARDAETSKGKDAARGRRIIRDYDAAHVAAADEPVVRRAFAEAAALRSAL